MKSTEFCYWLQGYFELRRGEAQSGMSLTHEQVELIEKHLMEVSSSIPPVAPTTRLHSYSVGEAKSPEDWGKGHTLVNPDITSNEDWPAGLLVERLEGPISCPYSSDEYKARAAIREVAAAAHDRHLKGVVASWEQFARWLELEAIQ
jgi:hypothetical protein